MDKTSYTANDTGIPPGPFSPFASYAYVSKKPGQKPVGANCGSPPPRAISTSSGDVSGVDPRVKDWVERVEIPRTSATKTEDGAYPQDDQTGASHPNGFSSLELKEDIKTTGEPCNLMDSLDQVPPLPEYKSLLFSKHSISGEPEAQDEVYPTDELALFGIEEDQPKELRDTMKQKARRRKTASCQNSAPRGQSGKTSELVHPLPNQARTGGAARDQKSHPQGVSNHLMPRISSHMNGLVGMLEAVPGKVKLELKLGRLWFNDVQDTYVHSRRDGPLWDVSDMRQHLNEETDQCGVCFQSILSSRGADANELARLRAPGEPRWEAPDRLTEYEFTCSLENDYRTTWFKVVVNAETFEHVCVGLDEEVSCFYVHWPEYAWDMKVCATRARLTGFPAQCEDFAGRLVASLAVM